MAFHVTQCPGCDSTFNTSARLLESAAGRVRCGSCLTVFEAMQYFVDQDPLQSQDLAENSVFVGNNPQDYFDPINFLTRSALTDKMSDRAFSDVEITAELPLAESLAESEPDATGSQASQIESSSDSWQETIDPLQVLPAENYHEEDQEAAFSEAILLEEGGETESDIVADLGPDIDPGADPGLDSGIDTESELQGEQEPESPQFFTADLSLSEPSDLNQQESDFYGAFTETVEAQLEADELLIPKPAAEFPASMEQESDDEFGSPESDLAVGQAEADTDAGFAAEWADTAEALDAGNKEEEANSTEAIRARALEAELRDDEALEAIPEENLAALNQVSTPVELLGSSESRWLRHSLLATAMVLLSAILTAQFLWQRMAVYSQLTQIRPFYEFGCQWLTCELPVYSSIEAIRSDNLVVRSHPQRADALLVNVEFRNTADFPQAFPILILSFNTATNSIVALREFSPTEYLDPGLLPVSLMPVATPIQIRLELIDPGPDAVNYTLAFRRPSVFN